MTPRTTCNGRGVTLRSNTHQRDYHNPWFWDDCIECKLRHKDRTVLAIIVFAVSMPVLFGALARWMVM